ncbi:hypothetical protein TTHERM_00697570 (macronuclear) [Tetrahymena thermophila SB210]|uniref:Transmembrane protein n=1 Tax=Tetrahymena thermophila (strain SB210) TaxID=312017 RepID=Q24C19_TETTS|nr:hypothetical protein TTHERM_00697570 [Tetrahymena thermophila SB210]EAS05419.1 hypothetical protein TTHERM_00697570 [Tetrahymena thermophila SB210]|eukprot:XP_001025664.1 hypothetical protein TTHERM_00697570 [Tetrahymena thermophila SB210]
MNKYTLITLGVCMLIVNGFLNKHTFQLSNHQTGFDLSLCAIQKCFDYQYKCLSQQDCIEEASIVTQNYMNDPTNFINIFQNVKNTNLSSEIRCQKEQCNIYDYLSKCAESDVYTKKCFAGQDTQCINENMEYFEEFKVCQTNQYQSCSKYTDKEAFTQCQSEQVLNCARKISHKAKGKLAEALQCY